MCTTLLETFNTNNCFNNVVMWAITHCEEKPLTLITLCSQSVNMRLQKTNLSTN